MAIFAYVWEYIVKDNSIPGFLEAYGPEGNWVEFFSTDPAYLKTELYRDLDNPKRFVTTDYWVSKESRDRFRRKHRDEFEALDKRCEALTASETFLGDFSVVSDADDA